MHPHDADSESRAMRLLVLMRAWFEVSGQSEPAYDTPRLVEGVWSPSSISSLRPVGKSDRSQRPAVHPQIPLGRAMVTAIASRPSRIKYSDP